ncbi:MAG: GatB/YqeY domain-containing protein [SAR324 cluster bacterium]|nr:GatB/YqeY domain-containing protein [SAR324 cluster bacterium]MCZ6558155.1 GatB/YqeY domain-containing protein [SAR324 cluster bacterium]MCZ6626952.1 GatB/YqeY domain-containing protein [SAR324 cluster bacterium]MCZ6730900.1 GatB/YqeY domain-containing protein [SAR324 cluster bacterium]
MIDLDEALIAAMKRRDQASMTAYRALKTKAAVKAAEPGRDEAQRKPSEEEMLALVRREIKERKESNEFLAPSHSDYALNENIIEVLEQHLPAAMSPEDSEAAIQKALQEVEPAGPKDMGKVMAVLRQSAPTIDMGAASGRVKELLVAKQDA